MRSVMINDLHGEQLNAVVSCINLGDPASMAGEYIKTGNVVDYLGDWGILGALAARENIVFLKVDNEWVSGVCLGIDPGGDVILKHRCWCSGATAQEAILRAFVEDRIGLFVDLAL